MLGIRHRTSRRPQHCDLDHTTLAGPAVQRNLAGGAHGTRAGREPRVGGGTAGRRGGRTDEPDYGDLSGSVTNHGGIGLYEWDPRTLTLRWDDTLARIFAADRDDEEPFATWRRRVHPDDQERVIETFSKYQQAEDMYRLILDDGSIRYVLSRATQVIDGPDATPVKVAGVMIDVTTSHPGGRPDRRHAGVDQ